VQSSRREPAKGTLRLFKDSSFQTAFDHLMEGTLQEEAEGALDLAGMRHVATHSYHQERFVQLLTRAMEDHRGQVQRLHVRLRNNQGLFEKQGHLLLSLEQFKRFTDCTPDGRLVSLHVNLGKLNL